MWFLLSKICQFSICGFDIFDVICLISFIVLDFNLSTVLISDQTFWVCAKSILYSYFGLLFLYIVCLAIHQTASSVSLCFYDFFLVCTNE